MKVKPWTADELKLLRLLAPTSTAAEIGQQLGRSRGSVSQKAYYLKIRLHKDGERHHRTRIPDDVVERVRTLYDDGMRLADVARATRVKCRTAWSFVRFVNRCGAPARGPR